MTFCSKCGKQSPEGTAFCPGCGASTSAEAHQQSGAGQQSGNVFSDMMDTPEVQCDQADIEQNKIFAVCAYFGLLFLIPLLAAPNSKFARFHTNQGIVYCIAAVAAGFVLGFASVIFSFIPFFGWMLSGLLWLLVVGASLTFMILGIVNAAGGKAKELPLIGRFKILR